MDGTLIPYVIATSCVVIAAGTQFNGKPESAYLDYENRVLEKNLVKGFDSFINSRLELEIGSGEFKNLAPVQIEEKIQDLPEADKNLAAMLVKRDASNLADSLESLMENKTFSNYVLELVFSVWLYLRLSF